RWFKLHHVKRRARADQRIVPESSVQEHFAGMRFVVTRPLDPSELLQAPVTHASMHRTQAAAFVPNRFGFRRAPVMPKPSRQVKDNRYAVPHALRRSHGPP